MAYRWKIEMRLKLVYKSATTDYRPPTTDHRPPTTDHRPPTTDHRPPTTDHRRKPPLYVCLCFHVERFEFEEQLHSAGGDVANGRNLARLIVQFVMQA